MASRWRCADCQSVRMWHCSDPIHCGGMRLDMTPEEIRALTGEQLTALAYELSLMPDLTAQGRIVRQEEGGLWITTNTRGIRQVFGRWEPHANLAQSREVFFDGLRALGWVVAYQCGLERGVVRASILHLGRHVAAYWGVWGDPETPIERSETMALLRCAVLAVASERPQETPEVQRAASRGEQAT